jgi:hypothetical protein
MQHALFGNQQMPSHSSWPPSLLQILCDKSRCSALCQNETWVSQQFANIPLKVGISWLISHFKTNPWDYRPGSPRGAYHRRSCGSLHSADGRNIPGIFRPQLAEKNPLKTQSGLGHLKLFVYMIQTIIYNYTTWWCTKENGMSRFWGMLRLLDLEWSTCRKGILVPPDGLVEGWTRGTPGSSPQVPMGLIWPRDKNHTFCNIY